MPIVVTPEVGIPLPFDVTPEEAEGFRERAKAACATILELIDSGANVNAAASGSFDYLFAFCDRGQNWNNAGGRSITDPIYAGDFTPCLRWDVLFDKIITGVGWTYEAPELMDTLAAYWMPFLNSRNIRYTVNLNAKFFFNAYLNTDITLTGNSASLFRPTIETSDPAGRYSAGANSSYSIPLSGEYSFSFWTTLTVIGNPAVNSTAIGTLQIYVDNITSGVSLLVTSFPINPNSGADLVFYISGNATGIIAQTNDVIKLRYSYVQVTGVIANNVRIESGSSIFGGSGWKLNQITTAFEGFQIDFAANAPDMRQIDFITDVVKMHNLAVIEHPTIEKRLIFKTLPDYIGSGPTYDWTQKLDLNKDVVTYSTIEQQKAELYYSYSAGADAASKAFQQAGRIYGDFKIDGYTVNPSINASEFITGKQEIKLITQSTPALNLGPTHVPKFIDVNGSFVIPGPRCLYYSHTINIPKMFNAGNYVAFNAPTLSHYSVENPTIADFDLNWSPEVPLHNITTNPYFTLFNLYWRDYLNEIYSPDARIMEAYFQLEISDITPIDFSALIFIKDSYWRIIDVSEYKYGSQESTKVKLLKIVTPLLDCDVLPSSMDANGIIIFKDVNGDPASPTASCCVRYGYEWDPLNEVCYGLVSPDELLGNITIANTFNTALTRETKSATRSVVGTNNTVSDSNLNVIVSGNKVDIVDGNSNLLAIGDTLKLDTAVSGNTMIGKNVLTSSSGFHLGGGWKNNDKAQADGSTQYGIIMHGNKDAIAFSGQIITPPIENIAGNFLIIPNESYWMALVSITIFEELTGENYTALYHCNLWKTTGVSVGSIPILISEDNLFGGGITFGLTIDTSADPTQHRFDITVSGAGFPRTLKTTLAVQYTAVR